MTAGCMFADYGIAALFWHAELSERQPQRTRRLQLHRRNIGFVLIVVNAIAVLGTRSRGASRFRAWKLRRYARRSRSIVCITKARWHSRNPYVALGAGAGGVGVTGTIATCSWTGSGAGRLTTPLAVSTASPALTWLTNAMNPAPICVVNTGPPLRFNICSKPQRNRSGRTNLVVVVFY